VGVSGGYLRNCLPQIFKRYVWSLEEVWKLGGTRVGHSVSNKGIVEFKSIETLAMCRKMFFGITFCYNGSFTLTDSYNSNTKVYQM
jgi:hypothetical protein